MSGGEPSSIKQFSRCAVEVPVRAGGEMSLLTLCRFSGVWPFPEACFHFLKEMERRDKREERSGRNPLWRISMIVLHLRTTERSETLASGFIQKIQTAGI